MSNLSELFPSAGGEKMIYETILTSSQTWAKPADVKPDDIIEIYLVGGGGSTNDSQKNAMGGEGVIIRLSAADIEPSVSCVVGAGGVSGAGGDTSFGKIKARGGKAANTTESNRPLPEGYFGSRGGGAYANISDLDSVWGGGGALWTGVSGKSVFAGDGRAGGGTPSTLNIPGGAGNSGPGARGQIRIRIFR